MTLLTIKAAREYAELGKQIEDKQDIGERRKLRLLIQERHGLTELQAINVINGYNLQDYVAISRLKWEQEEEKSNEYTDSNNLLQR